MYFKNVFIGNISDDDLVDKIIKGSQNAEDLFYRKYYFKLFDLVAKNFKNIEETEDLVQDAFIITIMNIRNNKYEHHNNLFNYLKGVSWVLVKKARIQRKTESVFDDNNINVIETKFTPGKDEIEITTEERIKELIFLIKSLDHDCKVILDYIFFKNLKPSEIVPSLAQYETAQQISKKKYKCIEKLKRRFNIKS